MRRSHMGDFWGAGAVLGLSVIVGSISGRGLIRSELFFDIGLSLPEERVLYHWSWMIILFSD